MLSTSSASRPRTASGRVNRRSPTRSNTVSLTPRYSRENLAEILSDEAMLLKLRPISFIFNFVHRMAEQITKQVNEKFFFELNQHGWRENGCLCGSLAQCALSLKRLSAVPWFNPQNRQDKLFHDYWRSCFKVNFSHRQEGFDGVLYNL